MKFVFLFFASWLAGLAAYLGSGMMLYHQRIGRGDLIAVAGDPLADVRMLETVPVVIKGGAVFDPAELMRSVRRMALRGQLRSRGNRAAARAAQGTMAGMGHVDRHRRWSDRGDHGRAHRHGRLRVAPHRVALRQRWRPDRIATVET